MEFAPFCKRFKEFSNRFKDHSLDDYLIKLLYEDLSYLTVKQLDHVLSNYFKYHNENYFLPSHKTIVFIAKEIYKPKTLQLKKNDELKFNDCPLYCDNGILQAQNKQSKEIINFKCLCGLSKTVYEELPQWKNSYNNIFDLVEKFATPKESKVILQEIIGLVEGKSLKGELPKKIKESTRAFEAIQDKLLN